MGFNSGFKGLNAKIGTRWYSYLWGSRRILVTVAIRYLPGEAEESHEICQSVYKMSSAGRWSFFPRC